MKRPAACCGTQRRSDGVDYLIERLEALMGDLTRMKTGAEVLAAVRALATTLQQALPGFHADVAGPMARAAVIATMQHHLAWLKAEAERLANEERRLSAAEEARRGVPRGTHYERIMRAMRETNREINRLEWCLAPLRSPFGPKAR